MKSKALSKWLMLLAVAVVLIAGVFALAITTNAAESEGMEFTSADFYQISKHISPNGPVTFETEIYIPEANRNQRGVLISNYNDGTYEGAFSFEVGSSAGDSDNGKISVFSQLYGNVVIDHKITDYMGTDANPQYVKIAITVDTTKTSDNIILYVNGEKKATATNANVNSVMYNTQQTISGTLASNLLSVGGDMRPTNNLPFLGSMKNIAMYSGIRDYSTATYFDTADENMLFGYDMTKAYDGFLEDKSGNLNHANNANWTASEGRTFREDEDSLYMTKGLEEMPFSYEAVIYAPLDIGEAGPILSNYPNASGDSIMFQIKEGGKPGIRIYDDGAIRISYSFNYDIRRNAYVHVAITHEFDGVNKSVFKCYVDGELVGTCSLNFAFTFDLDSINETGPITLGHCGRASLYYQGNIKNAALHNRTLTAEEVKASYENGVMANKDSLIAYYDLTGSAATAVNVSDSSGNGYDLKPHFYEKDFETEDYDYSFAVIGDTQFLVREDAQNGTNYTQYIYDWIVDNYDSKKMRYVIGLGDIIDNGKYPDGTSSKVEEWAHAYDVITSTLGENNIPYSLAPGNHDFMRPSDTGFQATFGSETTLTKNITGYYESGKIYNYYMNFDVEGTQYMLLVLEYGANDDILAWADEVIAQNKQRRVIVTTHGYMNNDGTTLDYYDTAAPRTPDTTNTNYLKFNNGDEMWDEMVRKHPNIIMVLSGHIPNYNNFLTPLESKGDYGNTVYQFLIDPQTMDTTFSYRTGMVAMFYFRNGGKDVSVEYVSTYRTAQHGGKEVLYREGNQFDFTIEEAPKEEDKGEINVWLIGGQSNAAGYAQGISLEQVLDSRYTNGFDNILYYGYSENWQSGFTPVKAGLGSNSRSGAELGIAEILGNTGEMNAIIRYAEGASCICPSTTDADAIKNGTWTSPSYITANGIVTDGTKVGLLYNNFINTVDSAIAELERMGYTPVIKGMWWMQGEAETYIDNTIGADKYEALLTALIGDVRSDVGAIVGEDLSAMPFVFGRIYENPNSGTMPYLATVQAAQESVAKNVANTALVDPADFASVAQHDGWYFDAATQGYLGRSFIEKACEINGEIIVSTSNIYVDFTGGGLYPKTSTDNITVGITVDDTMKITGVTKTVGSGAAEAVALTEGEYSFALSGESVTFDVTLDLNEIKTEYGTIPVDYVDADKYPFIVFVDGKFGGAATYWREAIDLAVSYVDDAAEASSVATILTRRDYEVSKTNSAGKSDDGSNFNNARGKIVLDLNGKTITAVDTYLLSINISYNTTASLGYASYFEVKGNGTLKNGRTGKTLPIIGLQHYDNTADTDDTKVFDLTFTNVTFAFCEDTGAIVDEFTGKTGDGIIANYTVNDCTVNFTDAKSGISVFRIKEGNGTMVSTLKINGGTIITGDLSQNYIEISETTDTVIYGKGSDGKYMTLIQLTSSAAPAPTATNFKNEDDTTLTFGKTSTSGSNTVYTLGEPIKTQYGDIPFAYQSVTDYPFAVFRNGSCIGAYANWGIDTGNSALSDSKTAGSVILLRRDFTLNEANYTNLSQTRDNTVFDLGGYTFTSAKSVFRANKKTTYNTGITVKNGTFLLTGANPLFYISTSGSSYAGGYGFTFNFANVTVKLSSASTTKNVMTSLTVTEKDMFMNLNFTNCIFDTTDVKTADINLFNVECALYKINIVVKGGEIKTNGMSMIADSVKHSDSSMSFAKAEDGSYTLLTLPSGVTPKDATVNNGAWTFVKSADDGTTATYTLTPTAAVGLDFTPKASITLDSNLIFNIYIPEHAGLKSATLNGDPVTLGEAKDGYYLVSTELAAKEAAKELKLVVTLEIDGTSVKGTFTFSLTKYVSKILAADLSVEEKTLVKDILAYVRSAYVYFNGATDETAEIKAIDAVLADYSAEFSKVDVESSNTDGVLKGATFVLEATPRIRFYLPSGANVSEYVFKIGSEVLEYTMGTETKAGDFNGLTYVDISLYAYRMIDTITITKGDSTSYYHINSYYDFVSGSEYTEDDKAALTDLVEKFYTYCKSADAYRTYVLENQ